MSDTEAEAEALGQRSDASDRDEPAEEVEEEEEEDAEEEAEEETGDAQRAPAQGPVRWANASAHLLPLTSKQVSPVYTMGYIRPVSYTHLTLPTKRIV